MCLTSGSLINLRATKRVHLVAIEQQDSEEGYFWFIMHSHIGCVDIDPSNEKAFHYTCIFDTQPKTRRRSLKSDPRGVRFKYYVHLSTNIFVCMEHHEKARS